MQAKMNIVRVMFRWQENPTGTLAPSRRLWIETADGDRSLVTFAELDAMSHVGEPARRLLVRAAIRQLCGRWNSAKWLNWVERHGAAALQAA